MAKKSVDELWKELNKPAGSKPGARRQVDKLWDSFSNDARPIPSGKQSKAGALSGGISAAGLLAAGRKTGCVGQGSVAKKQVEQQHDQITPAVSVERALQMLQDPCMPTRRAALASLQVGGLI